jgi:hypothetical protein
VTKKLQPSERKADHRFRAVTAAPNRDCVATAAEILPWNKGLENLSNQPRSGGYEVSPARDRGPQLAPLLCELGWLSAG